MKGNEIVFDAVKKGMPKKFRKILDASGKRSIFACGAFNFAQLKAMQAKQPCMILDLRKEVHVYIDDEPVSIYGEKNWHAKNWSPQEIQKKEREFPPVKEVFYIKKKDDESRIIEKKGVKIEGRRVETERQWAKRQGYLYQRFFIPDHCPPSTDQLRRIHQFFKNLSPHLNLIVHCRGGSGRTTTFLALLQLFQEGKALSLNEILENQVKLGGKNLLNLPSKGHYKYKEANKRIELVKKYYKFINK